MCLSLVLVSLSSYCRNISMDYNRLDCQPATLLLVYHSCVGILYSEAI